MGGSGSNKDRDSGSDGGGGHSGSGGSSVVRRLPSPSRSDSSKSVVSIDYSRYVKRFGSSLECGSSYCKDLNYR